MKSASKNSLIKSTIAFICFALVVDVSLGQSCSSEDDVRCFDETCATPLSTLTNSPTPCECEDDDIGVKFSDCDSTNTSRSLVYFWKPPATCQNGVLPPPITGVPCDLTCEQGKFLNTTTSPNFQCNNCTPGTFSVGGGKKWTDWGYVPAQFTTYCAATNTKNYCQAWKMNGDSADSGNNYGYDSLESILELRVKLVRQGYVRFEYKVSGENNYDGLQFIVNDLRIFFKSVSSYTTYNYTLAPGYYTILWKYYKDRSITAGEDKATLRMVEVMGTTYAVTQCESCDYGFYNPSSGANQCLACPAGNYSNTIGATSCPKCQPGTYSFMGAKSCIPSRPCNNNTDSPDLTYNVSMCVSGQHTKYYQWIQPRTCDNTANLALPSSIIESCAAPTCPPGTYANGTACRFCPPGSAATSDQTGCVNCTAGQRSSNLIAYIARWRFPNWPQGAGAFSTSCAGDDCLTNGWRFGEWFTDSGAGHGRDAASTLTYAVNAYAGATVTFNYTLMCRNEDSVLLSVDNILVQEFPCSSINASLNTICNPSTSAFTTYSFALQDYSTVGEDDGYVQDTINSQVNPYGNPVNRTYIVQWSYVKRSDAVNDSCDRIAVASIKVDGLAVGYGGSSSCVSCPAGSISQDRSSSCTLCPVGQTSSDRIQCSSCDAASFADFPGTPQCESCGWPTAASSDGSTCEYNCSAVEFPDTSTNTTRVYDLSRISLFNVTYLDTTTDANTTREDRYYGSLCSWNPSCSYPQGDINSYVCYRNGSTLVNLGKVLNLKEMNFTNTATNTTAPGLFLAFSDGDHVQGSACSTSLTLYCDPSSSAMTASVSDSNSFPVSTSPQCVLSLVWATKYACPLCTSADYGVAYGDCSNSKQSVTYYQSNQYCYGGTVPASTTQSCDDKVSVKTTTLVVVTVLGSIALAAALGGLGLLYYRHRKLYASYSQLRMNVPLDEDDTAEPQFKSLDDE